jgi:isopenicillin N synthase-like dioxygenase
MQILTADYKKSDAQEVFVESLKNTGFGVLKNHPIEFELICNVYQEWEKFFNSEDKHQYLYDKEKHDGYFPYLSENAKNAEQKDLKEFYHYYAWGRYPHQLSNNTRVLRDEMTILAAELLQWIQHLTPNTVKETFSMPLPDMIYDSPKTLMRILYYPPLTGKEHTHAVRAAAHEDIDLLTLLPAATATGLQVKDSQGRWHDVESDPGTIVINAGDMLQMCSNHYYRSTTHQVVNPVDENATKPRLSMPLFLHPKEEVVLSSTHTAKSYLHQRLKELGLV